MNGTPTPDLTHHHYLGFTLDEPEDYAAQRFHQRYGAPPEHIIESLGILYVGPIPDAISSMEEKP